MSETKLLDGKKTTVVCQYFPPEGGAAANRMRFFAYWLHKHGAEVNIVTAMPNYPQGIIHEAYRGRIWQSEKEPWGTVLRAWCYASPKRSAIRRLLNYFSFMCLSLRWLPVVKRSDVVIFSSGPMFAGFIAFLSAKIFGTKVILDVRDIWPDRIWESGAIRLPKAAMNTLYAYERFMYRNSVSVMCVTKGVCDIIRSKSKNSLPIELIRNCDQETDVKKVPTPKKKRSREVVVVESGTLGWVQDPEMLCLAYKDLLEKGVQNILLKFAGSGPRVEALKECIGVVRDAYYMGNLNQEELWHMLFSADIGVATLKASEHNKMAVSRRIYDYARAGLAIVYAGEGEGADIVGSSGAGIVVPPGDRRALADTIEMLATNRDVLERWKSNSRLLLEGEFSASSIGMHFIQTVREV